MHNGVEKSRKTVTRFSSTTISLSGKRGLAFFSVRLLYEDFLHSQSSPHVAHALDRRGPHRICQHLPPRQWVFDDIRTVSRKQNVDIARTHQRLLTATTQFFPIPFSLCTFFPISRPLMATAHPKVCDGRTTNGTPRYVVDDGYGTPRYVVDDDKRHPMGITASRSKSRRPPPGVVPP